MCLDFQQRINIALLKNMPCFLFHVLINFKYYEVNKMAQTVVMGTKSQVCFTISLDKKSKRILMLDKHSLIIPRTVHICASSKCSATSPWRLILWANKALFVQLPCFSTIKRQNAHRAHARSITIFGTLAH